MKYTTKIKSWALALAMVVTTLFAGSAAAQTINVYNGLGGTFLATYADLQTAINAAPAGGEVRIVDGQAIPGFQAEYFLASNIVITTNFYLTAGAGGAIINTNGFDFNINSNTTTLGSGPNNIDIDITGTSDFTVAVGATLDFGGVGNTIRVNGAVGGNVNILGQYLTQATGKTDLVTTDYASGMNWSTNNAPEGIYIESNAVVLNDGNTGTFGNLYWAPQAATNFNTGAAPLTLRFADDSEVVFNANAGIDLNFAVTLNSKSGTAGAFDVQLFNGQTVFGASAFTTNGNLFSNKSVVANIGTVTVGGNATFQALAASTNGFTLNVTGNLNVESGAWANAVTNTVTVGGNVSDLDANFLPNLTMNGTTPSTLTVANGANNINLLVVGNGEVVNMGSSLLVATTLTTNNAASALNIGSTFGLTVGGAVTNNGSITKSGTTGTVTLNGTVSNASGASITHGGSGVMSLGTAAVDITTNSGTITNSGSGTMNIWQLTNNVAATTQNTAGGTLDIRDLTNPNNGLITNTGSGNTIIDDVTVGGTANAGTISNTGAGGTLTIQVDIANSGTLARTNGSFVINGDLTNTGAVNNSSSNFGGGDFASRLSNATTDGIQVFGDVSSTTNYNGQIIVDATTATRFVTGTHGSLGVRSGAFMVTAGGTLTVGKSLILHSSTFNLAANPLNLTNTDTSVLPADTTPNHGIMMATNTMWTNGTVNYNGNGKIGFFQTSAGVPAGSFFVNTSGGQVQLLSNVHVSNITVASGATVRKPFNAFCFDLVVAGTSTINGAILECGVFTITNAAAGSIRAQLIANGFDPDNMNQSVQIAIGNTATIDLTDAVAENNAPQASWLGVTIVNTQSRFIMSSGTVNLNFADLTLRGAFVYDGDWSNAAPNLRAKMTAQVNSATSGGWLVFSGLNVPNADFIFVGDGVNSTVDGFVLRRVKFNRTGNSPIRIVDNNNVNAGNVPSSVVVSEKLEINGVLQAGDNNIKWIGGNNTVYSASVLANRSININTNDLVGSGFFWLANNHISANDPNTIQVTGAAAGIDLQMQLLADGDAGQRTYGVAAKNALKNIVTVGNGGMNYVRRGWLVSNELTTVDGDFTLGLDQGTYANFSFANFEVTSGLNFTGNLFIMDNNSAIAGNPRLQSLASLILVAGGTTDRVTTVNGIFQTASFASPANQAIAGVVTGAAGNGRTHNLRLMNRVIFGANNEYLSNATFSVPRPSRVVFASATNRNFEFVPAVGPTGVRIQRVQFAAGSTTTEYTLPGDRIMEINDLLLSNGLFRTNGALSMVDLSATDPSWAAGSTNNLSIVTRDRTGSTHGQMTRGLGSFGAYTQFAYDANGGAPYTVQHIGDQSRFTADEVPGLNVTNASGNGNNSVLNRLVVDVAAGTEFELAKDLIILTRIEALTGTVDIVASAFLDLANNVQWVHGHAVLTDVAAGVIRFPNTTGNTAPGAGTNARYDLLYVSKVNHTTGYEYLNGVGVRDLTVVAAGSASSPITLTLSGNKEASGTVRVVDGVLNLDSKTLKITGNLIVDGAHNGNNFATSVNNNGNAMVSGWFPNRAGAESPVLNPYNYGMGTYDNGYGRVNDANGTLEFVGGNGATSYIVGYVQTANKQVSLPNVVVTKTGTGMVIFDIDQAFTATPDEDINRFNVLSFLQNSGTTHLRPGATLDYLPAVNGSDAPFSGATAAELTSGQADGLGTGFNADRIQHWFVRQNMTLLTGNFYSWGATMTVDGNYLQGTATPTTAIFFGGQNGAPLNGAYQWALPGSVDMTRLNKQVNGNFTVLLDEAANTAKATTDNANVHRYYLSNGWLGVAGNYAFDGHADVTSGIAVPNSTRGFRGTVEFNRAVSFPETAALQSVRHVQNFRAFFEHVTINGRGIALSGTDSDHMWVNDRGVVTFALGNIVTGPARELILQNATVDTWNANEIQSGAVYLSGSNSFVEGNLRRYMAYGGTTGGLVEDGYIFPLGQTFTADDAPAFSGTNAAKRFYRPMTLQFPANLGQTIHAVATSLTDGAQMIDPSLKVQGRSGTAQNPGAFYTIDLTTTSDMYWNVKFNQLPALEPNIRLGVQGLLGNQNNNIDDMRIVTPGATQSGWRLAGVYDLTVGGPDDTYNPNDFIDGIPTFIQEGPGLLAQQYNPAIGVDLRVATNSLSNPFDGPGTIAYLQVIHNSPAATVDVLINGITVLNDFTYQSATPFIALAAETAYDIEVKTANGATTLLSINGAVLGADQSYILIAQGGNNGKAFEVKVVDNARRSSTVANGMQYFFSHGVTNGPTVNVERVTTSTPRTLEQLIAVNAAYGSTTSYMTQLNPSISTLQLKAGGAVVGQYLFDFGNYAGETMTLLATGAVGGTGANALTIIGVDAAGNVLRPQVTTSDEGDVATELPAEFTLNGNFPNPFNPTTNISFDLPEQANVRVEIVDLLGRQVMTVAPQSMSAGANKVITVDAARLSSGVYFYRVIAEGATKTFVQGSKFTLVK